MSINGFIKKIDRRFGIRNRLRGMPAPGFDLSGEKLMDWGWCLANLPKSPRMYILDVGCCEAPILPTAIALGHNVVGIDMSPLPYQLKGMVFHQDNFLEIDLDDATFDIVVLCSIVEHIGLIGRYNQNDLPDGDFLAMEKVSRILKPDGG